MNRGPRRLRHVALAMLLGALGCDAFEPPVVPQPIPIPETPEPFCPGAQFARVSPRRALEGPLFAWVTSNERESIEAGGGVLLPLPLELAPEEQHLAAAAHDTLLGAGPFSVRAALEGQPRVGRTFWPLAFSAPRATEEHDQLLAIWLRQDAWMAAYMPSDFTVADVTDTFVPGTETPGRIAGVDMTRFAGCLRMQAPERGFVIFRPEAIERLAFGLQADAPLAEEVTLLRQLLQQVRSESDRNPADAFFGLTCDSLVSPTLCVEDTYFQALAWPTGAYLPTASALSTLIDIFENRPTGEDSVLTFTSAAELEAWTSAWPGHWKSAGGTGGTGGLGVGGFAGAGGLGGAEG